jgi:Zn-dependent peptidase ImmA (M78 family)
LAKKLNTVLIGDVLEAKAFELFSQLLKDERLFVPGKTSKITRKAKYYSKDREADIIFDLAIETTMPGSQTYSMLTLFECKNYGDSVQVGDVETFSDRVRQVGGHKGIMVTSTPFQRSALMIAKSRKIGIVRVNKSNEIEWINHRKDEKDYSGKVEYLDDAICGETSIESAILATIDGAVFESIQDLFIFLGIFDQYYPPLKDLKIPYKDDTDIEKRINELVFGYCYDHYKLNIDRFCERVSEVYDAVITFNDTTGLQGSAIGRIQYDPLTIHISPSLVRDSPRWRFTVAHEIGHLVLHSHILKEFFAANTDDSELQIISPGISGEIKKRMEIQANKFASLVLMPTGVVESVVLKYFNKESIGKGHIFMDHQIQNIKLGLGLFSEMEEIFGVSKEAAKVKLWQMGILKGGSDGSVNDHLRKMSFRNDTPSPF